MPDRIVSARHIGPTPRSVNGEHVVAEAWIGRQLRWEARLAQLHGPCEPLDDADPRGCHGAVMSTAGTVPRTVARGSAGGETITFSDGGRLRLSLVAVLLGATLTAGVLSLTPPSRGRTPSNTPGVTPVAHPVSHPAFDPNCHWRPRGWFCTSPGVFRVWVPGLAR